MVEIAVVLALWAVVIVAIVAIVAGEANDARRIRRFTREFKARGQALDRRSGRAFAEPAE